VGPHARRSCAPNCASRTARPQKRESAAAAAPGEESGSQTCAARFFELQMAVSSSLSGVSRAEEEGTKEDAQLPARERLRRRPQRDLERLAARVVREANAEDAALRVRRVRNDLGFDEHELRGLSAHEDRDVEMEGRHLGDLARGEDLVRARVHDGPAPVILHVQVC
jgi:hypothetical protein